MQTIAICEMKEEDTMSQILFWEMMNDVLLQNGYLPANFRGFMANEAGANCRAVQTVFNNGAENIMVGRERSCLFHWEQSLQLHTVQCVGKSFQDEHKRLCEKWRCASNEEEATTVYRQIRGWWTTSKFFDANLPQMDCLLSWWNVRHPRWKKMFIEICI